MLKTVIQEKLLSHFFRQVRRHYADQLLKGGKVMGGEYANMQLPEKSLFANFSYAQVVGIYELFLQNIIAENIKNYDRFIDMGCGCGYHSNGVAFKHKKPSLGIDINSREVEFATSVASQNKLENLSTYENRFATRQDIKNGALHLIDIEGGEWDIFNGLNSNECPKAAFIIELHKTNEKTVDDLKQYLQDIFKSTHKVAFVGEAPIIISEEIYAKVKDMGIPRRFAIMLTNEMRDYYQEWAVITP